MSTTYTTPETNLINKTVMTNAQVREIEFTEMFTENIKKLVEALGITRKIAKTAGTTLKTYKASGTLQSGTVAEGDIIPLSKYAVSPVSYQEITLKKWRKATSVEAITEYGFNQAVTMTTDRMLKDIQKTIRTAFFTFLATGTGTASGSTLQAALANAWGKLEVLFEDSDASAVYFLNPMDVANYLGSASITTQTAFGMSYIENFLGLGTVILDSKVPAGKFYATAKENIVLYYIAVNGADIGEAFSFTSDATGYIGIHEVPDYTNMTASDTVLNGMVLFAERIDGVVVGTIGSTTSGTSSSGN